MEETVRQLTELGAEQIAVVAFTGNGQVFSGYYEMNIAEMQAAGGTIITDAVMETVKINFKELQEEAEEDGDEE
jgi:hypothetical protein